MMLHLKNTQSGRSMIEMLAVLAIIGIISVGAIAALNQALIKYRTSRTFTEIRAMNQNIANLYSYTRHYPEGNADMALLCENDVFPTACRDSKAYNPFGGEYQIVFQSNYMQISVVDVPVAVCNELKNQTWGQYLVDGTTISCTTQPSNSLQTFQVTLY